MKWANKELPTLEEAAELLAETDRRYFLGKAYGCTEPGTITPPGYRFFRLRRLDSPHLYQGLRF